MSLPANTDSKETAPLQSSLRPLRILFILHMPWSRDLGGPRVSVELADEFKSHGHSVDKFDINDAFPKRTKFSAYFLTSLFHKRACSYVQKHGREFDVIQAEQGNLPYSKRKLKFSGLLVAHSSGLSHLHEKALQALNEQIKQRLGIRHFKQQILHFINQQISGGLGAVERSFDYADKIILINKDELNIIQSVLGYSKKAAFLPNGLSDKRLKEISASAAVPELRLNEQQVVFIGRWSRPKGSGDFPALVRLIRHYQADAKFLLLGTGCSEAAVISCFQPEDRSSIQIVQAFRSEELPGLLSKCTVGVFPSYTEGFGIGVLEKLAAGIPCVAYDIPGPREMLSEIKPPLMVPVGNVAAMANRAVSIMQMPANTYSGVSTKCAHVASSFRWKEIAERTLEIYHNGLKELSTAQARTQDG